MAAISLVRHQKFVLIMIVLKLFWSGTRGYRYAEDYGYGDMMGSHYGDHDIYTDQTGVSPFHSPFESFGYDGQRSLGYSWELLGETNVYRNFVRLLPDYRHKYGGIVSTARLGEDKFYGVLHFRISSRGGPAKDLEASTLFNNLQRDQGTTRTTIAPAAMAAARAGSISSSHTSHGGDSGLGIWFLHPQHAFHEFERDVDHHHHSDSDSDSVINLHGLQEGFEGVGVTIDSLGSLDYFHRGTDNHGVNLKHQQQQHYDMLRMNPRQAFDTSNKVAALVNTHGDTPLEEILARTRSEAMHCITSMQYNEERADFSVSRSSRMKIVFEGQRLVVSIDERNNGKWRQCISIDDLGLQDAEWLSEAHLRITATNGKRSSHSVDIFSLTVYEDEESMHQGEAQLAGKRASQPANWIPFGVMNATVAVNSDNSSRGSGNGDSSDVVEQLSDRDLEIFEKDLNDLLLNMELIEHRTEHDLETLFENLRKAVEKLGNMEKNLEDRISSLESDVKENVGRTVKDLSPLREMRTKVQLHNHAVVLETHYHARLLNVQDRHLADLQESLITGANAWGRSWRLPFAVLSLLLLAGLVAFYLFYRRLKKLHLI